MFVPPRPIDKTIRVTIVAADGLSKRNILRLPDPFAVLTVDAEQMHTTSVTKKTLSPYWNESFDITVKRSSVIAVQVFDEGKSKRRDQCFLGVANIRVSDWLDLELKNHHVITLDLRKSKEDLVVHGKLIVYLTTEVDQPIGNPGPTVASSSLSAAVADLSMDDSSPTTNLSNIALQPAASRSGLSPASSSHATGSDGVAMPIPSLSPSATASAESDHQTSALEQPTSTFTFATSATASLLTPSASETSTARVYFADHNTKTTTWDESHLSSPLDANVPQYKQDFRTRLIYFRGHPSLRAQPGYCQINVRRNHTFEDSYAEIMRRTPSDLKKNLMINFEGEDGLDNGGLSREFFFLLSREMCSPLYSLFEYSARNSSTLQINPASGANPEQLNHFKFIGRCLGLGIFHCHFLETYFTVSFYKMILKKKVTLADLESVDAELHRGLTWMLENDITGVIDETFTTSEDNFGEIVVVDLRPGGSEVQVTEENKKEYIDCVVEHRTSKRVKEQSDAFMSGLSELIPLDLIAIFDEKELELVIGGISEIDVDDWAKYTDYRGYDQTDEIIQWFWKCVRSWPPERKSRLLQFATGTSRIPVNGFKDLQGSDRPRCFTIKKSGDPSRLPMSYTCFNRIDLPPYEDYASLEQKLTLAIEEAVGFGQE